MGDRRRRRASLILGDRRRRARFVLGDSSRNCILCGRRRRSNFVLGSSSRNYISSRNYCTVNNLNIFFTNKRYSLMKKKISLREVSKGAGGGDGGRSGSGGSSGGRASCVWGI